MSSSGDDLDQWRAIAELRDRAERAEAEHRRLWDAIATLRDDLHEESKRLTDVHQRALKALTDALERGRPDARGSDNTFV